MMLTSLTTRKLFRLMVTYCKYAQLFSVSKVNTVNLVWLCMWGCGGVGGCWTVKKQTLRKSASFVNGQCPKGALLNHVTQ